MVPASLVKENVGPYVVQFERFDREAGVVQPPWLRELRERAISTFNELGFPTTRDEQWRFTNVAPIARAFFAPASESGSLVTRDRLSAAGVEAPQATRLVIVNGRFDAALSDAAALPDGVTALGLRDSLTADPERLSQYLGRLAPFDQHAFRALNTAFLDDGVVVEIAAGRVIEEPIEILHVSAVDGVPGVAHPRALVIAGEQSQVRIVETYVSLDQERHFTNAVTEILVGAGAVVSHCCLELENRQAYHLGGIHAHLQRSSTFSSCVFVAGGEIVRNDVVAVLADEGADCTLNGVYLADGGTLVDNHTEIDHATPHCTSHELYRGIVGGHARGVFNGKIRVRPDAQKTDAKQTNKTLLLSDEAQINTKPELEIFANDVKCTHGATVGRLSDDQWFYLRARGIGRDQARSMLVRAFAGDVVDAIGHPGIRARVERLLTSRLAEMDGGGATS